MAPPIASAINGAIAVPKRFRSTVRTRKRPVPSNLSSPTFAELP